MRLSFFDQDIFLRLRKAELRPRAFRRLERLRLSMFIQSCSPCLGRGEGPVWSAPGPPLPRKGERRRSGAKDLHAEPEGAKCPTRSSPAAPCPASVVTTSLGAFLYRSLAFCRSDLRYEVGRRPDTAATRMCGYRRPAHPQPSLDLHARFRASIDHRAHSIILEPLPAHKLIHRKTRSPGGRGAL